MLPTYAAIAAVGALLGALGVIGVQETRRRGDADVVAEVAPVVDAVGEASNAERLAELDVSRALAEAPASTVVCTAAVAPDADDRVIALCATLACWSHVEGSETSAGLGCLDRGEVLDGLLGAPDAE